MLRYDQCYLKDWLQTHTHERKVYNMCSPCVVVRRVFMFLCFCVCVLRSRDLLCLFVRVLCVCVLRPRALCLRICFVGVFVHVICVVAPCCRVLCCCVCVRVLWCYVRSCAFTVCVCVSHSRALHSRLGVRVSLFVVLCVCVVVAYCVRVLPCCVVCALRVSLAILHHCRIVCYVRGVSARSVRDLSRVVVVGLFSCLRVRVCVVVSVCLRVSCFNYLRRFLVFM